VNALVEVGALRETPGMAKKQPPSGATKKSGAPKKSAATKKPAAPKEPAATKKAAAPKQAGAPKKAGASKKAAPPKTGWDEIAASSPPRPAARPEPTPDAVIIVNGIAELVRLGLGAMDPDQRATLLVALGKVGASLPKDR